MGRIVCLLFLVACQSQPVSRAQISVTGFREALSAASAPTLTSAGLAVSCADGTQDTAQPLSITLDRVTFSDVAACGQAQLTLTAQAQAAGAGFTFTGTADAVLVPGEVKVAFVGTLTSTGASGNTALSDLTVTPVGFHVLSTTVFDASTRTYAMVVPRDTQAVTVTATTVSSSAVVTMNGKPGATQTLPLDPRSGTIIDVQVSDTGLPTASSHVQITGATLPDDALLSILALSGGGYDFIVQPAFVPTSFVYTALAPAGAAEASVTAIPEDMQAAITINGASNADAGVPLAPGANSLTVRVVAEDGITYNDYTVQIPQAVADDTDASLLWLTTDVGTLVPAFAPAVTAYTVLLSTRRHRISIAALPAQASAQLSNLQAPLTLTAYGPETDDVSVTVAPASGQPRTYNIAVQRGLLDDLNFTLGGWDGFAVPNWHYQLDAESGETSIAVTATAPAGVSLAVTGGGHDHEAMISGQAVTLDYANGLNEFIVDASDGDESETYFLESASDPTSRQGAVAELSGTLLGVQPYDASDTAVTAAPAVAINGGVGMAVPLDGRTVYFTTSAGIGTYPVGSASASMTPLAVSGPIAIDPTGRYLFAATPGGLASLSLSDFSTISVDVTIQAVALAADPAGRFLYAARAVPLTDVVTYEILSTGVLRAVQDGEYPLSAAATQLAFAVDDTFGSALYAVDGVNAYQLTLDEGTFQLSASIGAAGAQGVATTLYSSPQSMSYTVAPGVFTAYQTPWNSPLNAAGTFAGVAADPSSDNFFVAAFFLSTWSLYTCPQGMDPTYITSECSYTALLAPSPQLLFFNTY